MDRLAAMEAFVAVVESGSFVRGSDRLGLSTTTVSRLVGELEAHLGARLLNRTTRKLSLTDAGRLYYEQCTALLADLAEAEAVVGSGVRAASGLLRVSAPVGFGIQHLGPLLPQYRRQQPEVTLELSLNDRVVDLVEEGHDVALRISGQLATSLVARPLAKVRVVTCASPDYLARHGTPATPAELARHRCLLYSYTPQPSLWTYHGAAGAQSVQVSGGFTANNGELLRVAALAGEGIVRQPTFIVGEDLRAGRLLPILQDFPLPTLTAYAVYPSRRHLAAKVRTFVDFLVGAWGEPPPWDAWMQDAPAKP